MSEGPMMPDDHEAWVQARIGKVTASRMVDVTARSKRTGDWLKARSDYIFELMGERLTGMAHDADRPLFGSMLWGVQSETAAKRAYESLVDEGLNKTLAFIDHPRIPGSGCSPDGLVGYDGLLELKCPETRTHLKYILDGVIPESYVAQMHWQLACHPERKWNDFVSFDSRMRDPKLRLFRVRLVRDEKQIAAYEKDAKDFLQELEFCLSQIESAHIQSGDV